MSAHAEKINAMLKRIKDAGNRTDINTKEGLDKVHILLSQLGEKWFVIVNPFPFVVLQKFTSDDFSLNLTGINEYRGFKSLDDLITETERLLNIKEYNQDPELIELVHYLNLHGYCDTKNTHTHLLTKYFKLTKEGDNYHSESGKTLHSFRISPSFLEKRYKVQSGKTELYFDSISDIKEFFKQHYECKECIDYTDLIALLNVLGYKNTSYKNPQGNFKYLSVNIDPQKKTYFVGANINTEEHEVLILNSGSDKMSGTYKDFNLLLDTIKKNIDQLS